MQTGIYKHYKGGYYQVLGVAAHSETGERMVVYVSLDASMSGPRMRVRPLDGPDGFRTPVGNTVRNTIRFMHLGDELPK